MIEIINEKFYNVLNKIEIISDKNPEVSDVLKDILELMMLTLERQDDANNHFNTNIMGLAGDVGNLHKEVENNSCCSQPQSNQNTNQTKPSDDILDIASFIMNDDSNYNDYINNKRKESKSFVLKQNPTSDEKSVENNIGVLSNFIETKLRK